MAKYQQYEEYKDSGIEWLGEIPKGWDIARLKWCLTNNDGGVWGDDPKGIDDTIVLRSTEQTVDGYWKIGDPAVRSLSKHEKSSALLKTDDLLLTKSSGSSLHIGKTTIVTEDISSLKCCYSNFMQRLRMNNKLKSKLVWYLLNNNIVREQFEYLSSTTTGLANLNASIIGEVILPISSIEEQNKVVNFLDHETAQIDTLIEKQQTLIQLLKEKRQAVISHAVTKGLNPDAPMKDSGVEWLGEVPEHWNVSAISKLTQKITNGYVGPTRDILVKQGVPYVQATHIKRGSVNFDDAYFVTDSWSRKHSKSILKKGDVLVVQTGAGTGDIGLVTAREEGYNCHALIILQPRANLILGSYLSLILQSSYGYAVLYSIRTGGMHPHLNCGEVRYVKVPTPTINEQQEIVEYIESMKSKFDELTRSAQQAIQLMQERRTALISAAVTGKIDVRGWQASDVK